MRVLDIITEATHPLDSLRTGTGPTNPLSSVNHRPNQVTALKQELSRHTLVTGFNQRTGEMTTGGKAFTGPIDEEWTPQLDAAIRAWKTSINFQLSGRPDRPLSNVGSPTISYTDIDELVTTELGSDGLLDVQSNGRLARRNVGTRGPLEGETYKTEVEGSVENVTDVDTMIEQAGFSVWFRIATEILESRRSKPGESWIETTPQQEKQQAIMTKLDAFYRGRMSYPDVWVDSVRRAAGPATAVYADGSEQSIAYQEKTAPTARELFTYYTDMAKRLWEKDIAQNQDDQETADRVNANPVTATTLDDSVLRVMATQLNQAFKNDVVAALPGGRSFYNDLEAIESIIGKIRTATDFDNFANVYATVNDGDILHEDLYNELEKDDYMRIVKSRLLAIRRISPKILHTGINFNDQEEIRVRYNNRNYDIQRQRDTGNNPVIQGYDNDDDYDAIVIDDILRLGIEQSGGNMPDFDTPPAAEQTNAAKVLFVNTIQQTYPEMVAFYANAEPFDQASVNLGGMRMRGIVDDAARMTADETAARTYITSEIADDREWLVGSEDGSVEAAANIRFDQRYQSEGLSNREFTAVSADADVSLNANEEEIFENLKSTQESVRSQAMDALLQSENLEQMYENIYRKAANSGSYLDDNEQLGGGEEAILSFLTDSTNSNSPIIRAATQLGVPLAAPYVSAKLFERAISGLGTKEDIINALIGQIKNRSDYELIDERYIALSETDDSLIDDLASEQFAGRFGFGWYGKLAEIIGDTRRLDMIRVELPRDIMNAIEDVEKSPSEDNIQTLRDKLNNRSFRRNQDQLDLVIDRLEEIADDFGDSDDLQPVKIIIVELTNELKEAYDSL